jgi:hypothetical protein
LFRTGGWVVGCVLASDLAVLALDVETVRIWGRSSSRAPGDPSTPPGVDGVQSWQAPLIEANPMDKLDRVRLPSLAPHGLGPGQVEVILVVIPQGRPRDRVLLAQRSGPCHQPQSRAFSQVKRLGLTPFSGLRPVSGLISGAPLTRNNSPVWGWWHGPERWAYLGCPPVVAVLADPLRQRHHPCDLVGATVDLDHHRHDVAHPPASHRPVALLDDDQTAFDRCRVRLSDGKMHQ